MTTKEMLNVILSETKPNENDKVLLSQKKRYFKRNPYYFFKTFYNIELSVWQNIYIKAILSIDKDKM
jgi:hypothetical protein